MINSELNELEERILALFEDIALKLNGAGHLVVDREPRPESAPKGLYVELRPNSEHAAPVTAFVLDKADVNLQLGHASVLELVDPDHEKVLQAIQEYIEAVTSGRFRETVWMKGDRVLRARGWVEVGGRTHRIFYRDAQVSVFGRGRSKKIHYSYPPYQGHPDGRA